MPTANAPWKKRSCPGNVDFPQLWILNLPRLPLAELPPAELYRHSCSSCKIVPSWTASAPQRTSTLSSPWRPPPFGLAQLSASRLGSLDHAHICLGKPVISEFCQPLAKEADWRSTGHRHHGSPRTIPKCGVHMVSKLCASSIRLQKASNLRNKLNIGHLNERTLKHTVSK